MWALPELAYLMFLVTRKFTLLGENTISLFSTLCAELRLILSGSLRYWGNELKRQHYIGITYVECEHAWDNNMLDVKNALLFFKALVAKTGN